MVDLPKNKSKLDNYQEEIIQMLKDGKSQYAIAKELGVVQSTISSGLRDMELTSKETKRSVQPANTEKQAREKAAVTT